MLKKRRVADRLIPKCVPWAVAIKTSLCFHFSLSCVRWESIRAKMGSRKEEDGSSGSSRGAGRFILLGPTEKLAKFFGGLHLIFLLCKPLKC